MFCDLIDVFASDSLSGNPLGVVHSAEGLSDAQMLQFTQWLGFSETTFLLPPTDPAADYRVRIFYPAGELPFAGHPTLGSCHAWLEAGGKPHGDGKVVQECGIGLVTVRKDGENLAFAAPPFTRSGALSEAEFANAIRVTGADPETVVEAVHVSNGPQWQLLRLRSAEDVLAAQPVSEAPAGTDIGLAGPYTNGSEADWELRAFFGNQHGKFIEDPVTGSFNAGVALHLFETGIVRGSYVAAQGRLTGARGRIECRQDADGTLWIGGKSRTIASGAKLARLG